MNRSGTLPNLNKAEITEIFTKLPIPTFIIDKNLKVIQTCLKIENFLNITLDSEIGTLPYKKLLKGVKRAIEENTRVTGREKNPKSFSWEVSPLDAISSSAFIVTIEEN